MGEGYIDNFLKFPPTAQLITEGKPMPFRLRGSMGFTLKKRLKSASFGADFLYDQNIDHTVKKAQNSNVD